jgi:hypothetical protein
MPITLTTPKTTEITTSVISSYTTQVEAQIIMVSLDHGYMDGENFVRLKKSRERIEGADFIELATGIPDGVKSRYEDTKNVLYTKLIELGVISGIVS